MRYTVTWTKKAEDQLAFYWMNTKDRQRLADASDRIDRQLKNDPDQQAVPFGEFYVYKVSPLAVLLRIRPDDRIIEVIEVLPFE